MGGEKPQCDSLLRLPRVRSYLGHSKINTFEASAQQGDVDTLRISLGDKSQKMLESRHICLVIWSYHMDLSYRVFLLEFEASRGRSVIGWMLRDVTESRTGRLCSRPSTHGCGSREATGPKQMGSDGECGVMVKEAGSGTQLPGFEPCPLLPASCVTWRVTQHLHDFTPRLTGEYSRTSPSRVKRLHVAGLLS